jgi:uncharacterized membrane protein
MPEVGAVEIILTAIIGVVTIGIFLLAGYAGIVLLARILHRFMPATTPPRDPALDALRTRFASGEIDEAEYERLRAVLQRG